MALIITDDCTACSACIEVCPNTAISEGEVIYSIEPSKCTECVGAFIEPQCVAVCPAECIVPDPAHRESREELKAKYERIHAA